MFVISNLLSAAAQVLDMALTAYSWIIIIRALVSWVSPDPFNPIVQFLHTVTEPVLAPIRRALPPMLRFGIDISPVIAIFLVIFCKFFLVRTLFDLSLQLRA
ncbi:MAG: YggT family protein [Candidatus Omnitrophica bacterium]|nr:YggT family protein [Candidatus Omnitrophota bacterium]MDD5574594.1 YggT family protein [Candidatus Omnitrophota bacterium]